MVWLLTAYQQPNLDHPMPRRQSRIPRHETTGGKNEAAAPAPNPRPHIFRRNQRGPEKIGRLKIFGFPMTILPIANDNHPFEAEFEGIPETFLRAYQNELFGWAKKLAQANQITIDLWNPPGATVVSMGWQGSVTLQSDAFVHPLTKKMKFVVRPATDEDGERIAKHCEELPAIMTAHKAAAQALGQTRPKMARWVFDGTVPDYFALRYAFELREWARNLKKIGLTKHIVLREGILSDSSPDEEQGAVLIQVTLKAKVERIQGDELQIVVSAEDEEQERRIKKHCEKMQRNKIPAGSVMVEPPRPGLPFLPNIGPGK